MKSIKKILIKQSLIKIILTIVVVSIFAIYNAYDEVRDIHDTQLSQTSGFLAHLIDSGNQVEKESKISNYIKEYKSTEHNFEEKKTYRIWNKDVLISSSPSAKKLAGVKVPFGYSNKILADSSEWRFFKSHGYNDIIIEVAEDMSVRKEILSEIILSFIIPILFLIPLLILIVYFGVSSALSPLIELSAIMNKKDANDFNKVSIKNNSLEINPLIKSINHLLTKIKLSFEKERSFTDHAAHELRTPLAVLKTQSQAISKKYNTNKELKTELEDLTLGVNRMTIMVDKLLSLSRLQSNKIDFCDVNLSKVVCESLKNIAVLAMNKNINLEVSVEDDLVIKGNETSLSLAVSNLIDNAIKYTPAEKSVAVSLFKKDGKVIFKVTDQGIGLDETDKKNMFEKFYRNKKQTGIGSGLGLSIVKIALDMHNAQITAENNADQGAQFTVEFLK